MAQIKDFTPNLRFKPFPPFTSLTLLLLIISREQLCTELSVLPGKCMYRGKTREAQTRVKRALRAGDARKCQQSRGDHTASLFGASTVRGERLAPAACTAQRLATLG